MDKWNRRLLSAVAGMALLLSLVYVGKEAVRYTMGRGTETESVREDVKCVVIDAGHGGDDPGKVGINGAKEKEINLQIAEMVKKYLEANDVRVIMTREDDAGLNDPDASNKKVQDMKRRIELIRSEERRVGKECRL